MWVFFIIVGGIGLLIGSTIQGWILQVAFKIATKKAPAFSDAFKTCFLALIVTVLINLGIGQIEMAMVLLEIIGICVGIIVYTLAISMFIATELKQALIISILMTGIGWLLRLVLLGFLAGVNAPSAVGG
jgi:hypothetical protein